MSRGHRTLRDARCSIHLLSAILMQAVPVKTSRLVSKRIVHVNNHLVPKVDINLRTRPLAINPNHRSLKAIRRCSDPRNIPSIMNCFSESKMGKAQGKKSESKHRETSKEKTGNGFGNLRGERETRGSNIRGAKDSIKLKITSRTYIAFTPLNTDWDDDHGNTGRYTESPT